jgi:hypothetical protein
MMLLRFPDMLSACCQRIDQIAMHHARHAARTVDDLVLHRARWCGADRA